MQTLEDISLKINEFIFTHHISEDGIICDEGEGNLTMIHGNNRRWSYVNTNEIDNRSETEDIQLHILNDAMDIIMNIQAQLQYHVSGGYPINIKDNYISDAPTETVDPHTSKCISLNCHPGCPCGNWDQYERYVQEENYMDMGCATEEDKKRLHQNQPDIVYRQSQQAQVQSQQAQVQSQTQVQSQQAQVQARQAHIEQNSVDQMMGEMDEMSIV